MSDSDGRIYAEIPLDQMDFVEEEMMYYYQCPCGDKFEIAVEDMHFGDDIAACPSCSLRIRVIFDKCQLP
ncbi:unnamed protein product, partial [Heterosigma akashiwo]